MSFEEKFLSGPDFTAGAAPDGQYAFTLEVAGKPRLRLGRLKAGEFSEQGALPKKLRTHRADDALSASFETASVIPFGCEYLIERDIELCDGFGTVTLDVSAVNRGIVGNLALEEVCFEGPWRQLEFLIFGETAFRRIKLAADETEFYRGAEVPVMIRLTAADGVRVEFSVGSDLWRHRAAFRTAGASGEFALRGNAAGVIFTRRLLTYAADAVIEKRPWRFKNLFAWSCGKDAKPQTAGTVFDLAAAALPETGNRMAPGGGISNLPCLTSAAARRLLRALARRDQGAIELINAAPGLCFAAAHLERPGKGELEHFDLEDYLAFYLWANRRLAKSGGSLRMTPAATGLFVDSVCAANFTRPLRGLNQD